MRTQKKTLTKKAIFMFQIKAWMTRIMKNAQLRLYVNGR